VEASGRRRKLRAESRGAAQVELSRLTCRDGTRNPMGFYPIRVRVWVNFHTHGFVNGHKSVPSGFMGTGLFL
jgi:hypothetical protein